MHMISEGQCSEPLTSIYKIKISTKMLLLVYIDQVIIRQGVTKVDMKLNFINHQIIQQVTHAQ